MGAHVHDGSISGWGWGRIAPHLAEEHGIQVPMIWTLGQAHEAHLKAHIAPQAEEAPMTQTTPHEHTAAEHRGDGPELAQHLGKDHGYHSSNDLENFVVTHRKLHAEADSVMRPSDADDGPRKLYEESDERKNLGVTWNGLGQESRDFWRAEYAKKQLTAAVEQVGSRMGEPDEAARVLWATETGRPEASWSDVSHDVREHYRRKIRQRQIGYGAASREHEERHANRRIMVDRFTAAMAGLNFDQDWAADDGIGPNARGALRLTFQRAAEQLLYTLERGGLLPYGPLDDGEQEAFTRLMDEKNAAVRARIDAERHVGDLRAQMAGQQRSLQEMAGVQADLDRQLQMALSQKDGLFSEMGEIRQQLEKAVRDRTETGVAFDRMNAQRVATEQELREKLAEATDERDRAQQALMAKLTEVAALREERDTLQQGLVHMTAERDGLARKLHGRTQALDEGRAKLRALVKELRDTGWEQSSVFQRLTEILIPVGQAVTEMVEDESVSTVTEASQAPGPVVVHGDTAGIRHVEVGEDNLLWARRFAEGGDAL